MYLKKLKIGNVELENNIILAPMAGITDLPFRVICKEYGAGLVCTEMVSSRALFYSDEKTKKLLNTNNEKRPISFQIFGSDEETFEFSANYLNNIADIPFFSAICATLVATICSLSHPFLIFNVTGTLAFFTTAFINFSAFSKSNKSLLPSPFFTTFGAGHPIFISIISAILFK